MIGLILSSAVFLLLLVAGVWVAVSMLLGAFLGLSSTLGFDRFIAILGTLAWAQNTDWVLISVPLFIFTGDILFQSGIMDQIYIRASKIVSRLPGGLIQTNIAACTLFAACSGSSVASAATIGSVGYPAIAVRNYNRPLALGSLAAGGTLGILIPPSIPFIIYGTMAEVSVGKLFIAGIFPGLVLASFFALYIAVRCLINPRLAPKEENVSLVDKLRAAAGLWRVGILALIIMGGLYGGIASPTEVSALGAAYALILAFFSRKLNVSLVKKAALSTTRQTCMILLIITCAKVMSATLIYYHFPQQIIHWASGMNLSPRTTLIYLVILYTILGGFFDGISMMVITVPFVVPLLGFMGVDLVWFGVIVVIMIEVGLLTPPVALNLYVIQGVTKEPFNSVTMGSLPYIIFMYLTVFILFIFPMLALYLPGKLIG